MLEILGVTQESFLLLRRAKFSVQVRDFLDLVVTRLSDLNGQDDARRRLSNTAGSGDPHNGVVLARARNVVGDGDGDPSSREVGHKSRVSLGGGASHFNAACCWLLSHREVEM